MTWKVDRLENYCKINSDIAEGVEVDLKFHMMPSNQIGKKGPWDNYRVIYFLIKHNETGNECVYIGQTCKLSTRVRTHRRKFDFDYVNFIVFGDELLGYLERSFIHRTRPKHNVVGVQNNKSEKWKREHRRY